MKAQEAHKNTVEYVNRETDRFLKKAYRKIDKASKRGESQMIIPFSTDPQMRLKPGKSRVFTNCITRLNELGYSASEGQDSKRSAIGQKIGLILVKWE